MNAIKGAVAQAIPSAVKEWGVLLLMGLLMAGGGWVASRALDRQHELIQAVCNTGLARITDEVAAATQTALEISSRQENLVPLVLELLNLQKAEAKRDAAKPAPSFP